VSTPKQITNYLRPQPFTSAAPALLHRKCACGGSPGLSGECEECQKSRLQRTPVNAPGQPLDAATRSAFEPRFGHDFSQVRVHADAQAAKSAEALHADAYTVGRDIVFANGKYSPETSEGRKLLAHELTHVAQQPAPSAPTGELTIDAADSPAEREASAVAERMVDAPQVSQQEPAAVIHRAPQKQAPQPAVIKNDTAEQKKAQAQVDAAVRTRFGIKGTSVSGHVDFVSQAEFARRFPASELQEKLVTLFLDFGTNFNSIFYQILDHNNQSYQITGWSSFALEQIRAFVKKGIDQGFFTGQTREYDVTTRQRFPPFKITPRELVAQHISGITNIAGEIPQRSVMVQAPSFMHTLVHETCHFYINSAFRNMVTSRKDGDEILRGAFISQILLEGLAEYFARDVMKANEADLGPPAGEPYQREVTVVWALAATLGSKSLSAAYFHGDKKEMRRLEKAIEEYKDLPEDWLLPGFVVDVHLEQEQQKKKATP
jgi:uncharacterized protein DUF4157